LSIVANPTTLAHPIPEHDNTFANPFAFADVWWKPIVIVESCGQTKEWNYRSQLV
jgi:hypothetical protein